MSTRSLVDAYRRHRFAWLFSSLLLTLVLHPICDILIPDVNPTEWLLALNLGAAVVGVERERWTRPLLYLAGAFALVRAAEPIFDIHSLFSISRLLWAFACLAAASLTVRHAFRRGPVDGERIFAALSAYLLVGLAFGVLYWVLEHELPGSFGPAPLVMTPQLSVYVSLTTISTLGPGDIVPRNGPAQGLVTFEAIGGQMYLAVLVARLVGLYTNRESQGRDSGDKKRE